MTIIHVQHREHPYVLIDTRPLADSSLSYRATGLLAYLLSKPDGWRIRMEQLIAAKKEGRDAVRAAFKELEMCGYARLVQVRESTTGARAEGSSWVVSEVPDHLTDWKPVSQVPEVGGSDRLEIGGSDRLKTRLPEDRPCKEVSSYEEQKQNLTACSDTLETRSEPNVQSLPLLLSDDVTTTVWEGFARVRQTLVELGLAGMDDPAYWQRIDKRTEGTRVYYLDELRKYALWLESAPPGKTRKDRRRQFANWIRKEVGRDDYHTKVRLLEGRT